MFQRNMDQARSRYVPESTEEPVMLAEVFITRRAQGDYLARLTIDDDPGWISHVADDPLEALEGAASAARDSLSARLKVRRLHSLEHS